MPPTNADAPLLSSRYTAAFQLAFDVHGQMVRKHTTIPYLAHVMSVSALVLEAGGDEDCAIAALLHDTVEDSVDGHAMLARIRTDFGSRVAGIVAACSDSVAVPGEGKAPWKERKDAYIAHLKEADADALLVSACDKLHNARAIVADLREIGNDLWQRFSTRSGADQLWYYQTLSDVFSARGRPPLAEMVREAVVEMTELGVELGQADDARRAWLTAALNTHPSLSDGSPPIPPSGLASS